MAYVIPPGAGGPEAERLRALVARYFSVYETRITPQSLVLMVHVDPARLEADFDALRQELWRGGYIGQIRTEGGEYLVEIVKSPPRRPWTTRVNLALLAATLVTTLFAGAFLWTSYRGGTALVASDFLWGALFFALPLMAILGLHELAHYVVATRHHVDASLPFFLPVPPPFLIFGTFGAFISLREPIPSKKALLDIGFAGPLAGFAVAVPVTLGGLFLSLHAPVLSPANCGPVFLGVPYGDLLIGTSAIWYALSLFFPVGLSNLNPLAIAGWVGLLVTAINLLPAGQLDGGHVFRALLGRRASWASIGAVGILFVMGFFYPGWFIFAFLVILLGIRHPPPLNDITPLDGRRKALGVLAVGILVTGIVLVPISSPSGSFTTYNTQLLLPPAPENGTMANLTFQVGDTDVVPHAFVLNGSLASVEECTLGRYCHPLNQSALQAYEANFTWTVSYPSAQGRSPYVTHGAGFTIPDYFAISSGGNATIRVEIQDPAFEHLVISLTVREVCSRIQGLPAGPETAEFYYPIQY